MTTTTQPESCTNSQVISTWSLDRRALRLIVAPVLDFDLEAVHTETAAGVGGMLFLGSSSTPAGLAPALRTAEGTASPPPMLMADEEGGGVQRLAPAVTDFPWAREMTQTMTPSQVESLATTVGTQMRALGVSVDLAPVLDVDGGQGPNATDADGSRSFSATASVVAQYGIAFVDGLRSAGVLAVVKHFPGLGSATGNTDEGPAATQPLSVLRSSGLRPFEAAIAAGVQAVMISNASVPGLTALPASLSASVIQGLLETQLGFGGLIVTDSLSAGAITQAGYSLPAAAVAAIGAGADMVLFGSTLTAADTQQLVPSAVAASLAQIVAAVTAAVASGALPVARLNDAVNHVLAAQGVDLCGSTGS